MKMNAFDLLLKQKRFDLIFKYIYLKNKHVKGVRFYNDLYIEHIRAFNDFYEENPSDGIPKTNEEDFIRSFDKLYHNMSEQGFVSKKCFFTNKNAIPIGKNGDIVDGAHRLVCAAVLGLDVDVKTSGRAHTFDYQYFQKKGLNPRYSDYAALEYVKLNSNAYIVNLQPVIPSSFDLTVEQILAKYGFIYYKKNVDITFNGAVNLKKLCYGSAWDNGAWIGNPDDGFAGAVNHAKQSFGDSPLRAYVFVCDKLADVLAAKSEIRALFNIGNYSVHINDTREEAIALAQTYFNENSLHMLNNRPYLYEDKKFDDMVEELKTNISKKALLHTEDFCGVATSVFGIRPSGDLDLFYIGPEKIDFYSDNLSDNSDEFRFYPLSPREILYDPRNHCYYHGIKFVTPSILLQIKRARNKSRDPETCNKIEEYLHNQ